MSLLVLPIQKFFVKKSFACLEKRLIFLLTYKEDEVFNAQVSIEEVGISFGNCHENSLHDSFQDQFDNLQGNVQFEHPSYGKNDYL